MFSFNTNALKISLQYLQLFSWIFLVACLPFYFSAVQRVALVLFFTSYIADFLINKQWKNFHFDHRQWIFILFFAFCLLGIIYHFFEQTDSFFIRRLETRLPFLGFAVLGFLGLNKQIKLEYIGAVFIVMALAVSIFIFCYTDFNVLLHSNDVRYTLHFTRELINNHMVFNVYLNTALVFVFYFLRKTSLPKWLKICAAISGLVIYTTVFLSDGRTGFITANLLMIMFLIYSAACWKKITIPFFVLIGVVFLVFVVSQHKHMDYALADSNPRFILWEEALKTIEEAPLLGHGMSDGEIAFKENCWKNEYFYNHQNAFLYNIWISETDIGAHSHNIFLHTMIEFGALGLAILLAILVCAMSFAPRRRRMFMLFFLTIVVVQGMFDMFGPGLSTTLVTLVITLLLRGHSDYEKPIAA